MQAKGRRHQTLVSGQVHDGDDARLYGSDAHHPRRSNGIGAADGADDDDDGDAGHVQLVVATSGDHASTTEATS